ncbi:tRNA 2-thiocytidine biosynthesis protein TtcA [Striga asiatica]|uniref:tRNA 2-thiocytidine biosynthesis protein TtcA n=1 Tax=Striga asiatica TaxID=4170 RepID=A0A5A7R885_STRAF|nr:tRNA 2-thiocytidine biosynthesis protein TtcA [Striga asiatica]
MEGLCTFWQCPPQSLRVPEGTLAPQTRTYAVDSNFHSDSETSSEIGFDLLGGTVLILDSTFLCGFFSFTRKFSRDCLDDDDNILDFPVVFASVGGISRAFNASFSYESFSFTLEFSIVRFFAIIGLVACDSCKTSMNARRKEVMIMLIKWDFMLVKIEYGQRSTFLGILEKRRVATKLAFEIR